MVKAFVILCGNKPDIELGKKLVLRDTIEDCDYVEINNDTWNKRFLEDLKNAIEFSFRHQNELDKYKHQYLVITSERYIVRAFIRL